jgi:hypothetical protein
VSPHPCGVSKDARSSSCCLFLVRPFPVLILASLRPRTANGAGCRILALLAGCGFVSSPFVVIPSAAEGSSFRSALWLSFTLAPQIPPSPLPHPRELATANGGGCASHPCGFRKGADFSFGFLGGVAPVFRPARSRGAPHAVPACEGSAVRSPCSIPCSLPSFTLIAGINGAASVQNGAARGRKGAAHVPGQGSVGDKSVALGGSVSPAWGIGPSSSDIHARPLISLPCPFLSHLRELATANDHTLWKDADPDLPS